MSTRFLTTVARARRAYEADCKTAGEVGAAGVLHDLRLHDLRHHAITQAASLGALSLPELMMVSGHRSAAMAMRYTHLSASALASKLARAAA